MLNGTFCIPGETEFSRGDDSPSSEFVSRQFIAGPENALLKTVHQTLQGEIQYNPLVLFGPSSVGKTHLLHLICANHRARHQGGNVLLLKGSEFARAYAAALELDAVNEFRAKHRRADLLVLDDLHQLTPKAAAQRELLHTIDVLLKRRRQIVVASRICLSELDSLLPPLASRLASGLTIPIAKPSKGTRRQLLAQLAEERGVTLSEQTIDQMLQDSRTDCWPKLNNALLRLQTNQAEQAGSPGARRAAQRGAAGQNPTQRQITSQVARYFRLKTSDLTGASRKQNIVQARGVAIYLVRRMLGTSFERIGRHFGGRDHSTVLHAYRRIALASQSDPMVRKAVREIAERLGAVAFT